MLFELHPAGKELRVPQLQDTSWSFQFEVGRAAPEPSEAAGAQGRPLSGKPHVASPWLCLSRLLWVQFLSGKGWESQFAACLWEGGHKLCANMHARLYKHTQAHTLTYMHVCTYTRSHMHARTHMHVHTCTNLVGPQFPVCQLRQHWSLLEGA